MSIFDRALHIPAERLFFEPRRAQHERVLLPLAAHPSPRFFGALALCAFAASACLCMGAALARSSGGGLVFAAGFIAAGIVPAAVAWVGLRDARRGGPLLLVDAEGVRDTRLGPDLIAWSSIVGAELVASGSGIIAVRLALARDGPARFNPFRLGGWSVAWEARHRTRVIALMLLDVRAHTLAHTILVLAARHGATIEQPSPFEIAPVIKA